MSTHDRIEKIIRGAVDPMHLEVVNESHLHNVPAGSESHFKVVVVSDAFQQVPMIQRHRKVNALLKEEFSSGLHALALHTMTPEEWFRKGGTAPATPECLGGGKDV